MYSVASCDDADELAADLAVNTPELGGVTAGCVRIDPETKANVPFSGKFNLTFGVKRNVPQLETSHPTVVAIKTLQNGSSDAFGNTGILCASCDFIGDNPNNLTETDTCVS